MTAVSAGILKEIGLLAPGVVGAVGAALLVPGVSKWQMDRQVRRLYLEGANKGVLGLHELELNSEDLIDRTPFGELRISAGSGRAGHLRRWFYVRLSHAVSALVIPHAAVTEGDPESFANARGAWWLRGRPQLDDLDNQ